MEKSSKLFLLFLMTVLLFSVVVTPVGSPFVHAENKPPVEYVDPLIGTDVYSPGGAMGEANVFPGATTPHGMVQLSPDTGRHIAGYLYSDDHIEGFSFTHFSGTVSAISCQQRRQVNFTRRRTRISQNLTTKKKPLPLVTTVSDCKTMTFRRS